MLKKLCVISIFKCKVNKFNDTELKNALLFIDIVMMTRFFKYSNDKSNVKNIVNDMVIKSHLFKFQYTLRNVKFIGALDPNSTLSHNSSNVDE